MFGFYLLLIEKMMQSNLVDNFTVRLNEAADPAFVSTLAKDRFLPFVRVKVGLTIATTRHNGLSWYYGPTN